MRARHFARTAHGAPASGRRDAAATGHAEAEMRPRAGQVEKHGAERRASRARRHQGLAPFQEAGVCALQPALALASRSGACALFGTRWATITLHALQPDMPAADD